MCKMYYLDCQITLYFSVDTGLTVQLFFCKVMVSIYLVSNTHLFLFSILSDLFKDFRFGDYLGIPKLGLEKDWTDKIYSNVQNY